MTPSSIRQASSSMISIKWMIHDWLLIKISEQKSGLKRRLSSYVLSGYNEILRLHVSYPMNSVKHSQK